MNKIIIIKLFSESAVESSLPLRRCDTIHSHLAKLDRQVGSSGFLQDSVLIDISSFLGRPEIIMIRVLLKAVLLRPAVRVVFSGITHTWPLGNRGFQGGYFPPCQQKKSLKIPIKLCTCSFS